MHRFFTLLLAASCLTAVGQVDDSYEASSNWQLLLELNNHEYWLLSEPLEWEPARDLCDSLGAYLYWPNDEAEHQAVWDLLPHGDDGIQFWTAIHQDFSVVECGTLNGGWVGPTGENQTFLPWYQNEPNNGSDGRESVVQFEWGGIGSQFNDAPGQNECDQGSPCECRFAHVILERETPPYCADPSACNYGSAPAIIAECDYTCCPGPGCCGEGMFWDWDFEECVITNPSDSNFDGCVQLNDLLDLLSAYGDCGAEESAWQCGDPLEYQGYDYETVQIGEQCWFAENLRAENYDNDDPIVSPAWYYWGDSLVGSQSFYGNSAICYSWSTWYDLCNSGDALSLLGRVYNLYAVLDPRGICPSGWHIPSLNEWSQLSVFLGGDSVSGEKLKSTDGWHPGYGGGGGSNDSEFNGRPGGYCNASGSFYDAGITGEWWSSTMANSGDYGHSVYLESTTSNFHTTNSLGYHIEGLSVRCIKDTE